LDLLRQRGVVQADTFICARLHLGPDALRLVLGPDAHLPRTVTGASEARSRHVASFVPASFPTVGVEEVVNDRSDEGAEPEDSQRSPTARASRGHDEWTNSRRQPVLHGRTELILDGRTELILSISYGGTELIFPIRGEQPCPGQYGSARDQQSLDVHRPSFTRPSL
jgi:hypothetical protein